MSDGGIGRLQQRFAAIPKEVRKAVEPVLMKSANELASTMRHIAPDDPATSAPDLKTSIEVTGPGQQTPPYSQPGGSMTVPEDAAVVTVGDHVVRYAHLVEYGTTKAAAQPFFWPTVRLLRTRATNRIKRAIGKAVREHWGRS